MSTYRGNLLTYILFSFQSCRASTRNASLVLIVSVLWIQLHAMMVPMGKYFANYAMVKILDLKVMDLVEAMCLHLWQVNLANFLMIVFSK